VSRFDLALECFSRCRVAQAVDIGCLRHGGVDENGRSAGILSSADP
jgi:hypothetical protein